VLYNWLTGQNLEKGSRVHTGILLSGGGHLTIKLTNRWEMRFGANHVNAMRPGADNHTHVYVDGTLKFGRVFPDRVTLPPRRSRS
jgi:hypothetical protein